MEPYALPSSSQYDSAVFTGNSPYNGGENWSTWTKPQGKGMVSFVLIGAGGGGGSGAIGAVSTAAGGGGGGSGAMTILEMPLALLPPVLYISVGNQVAGYPSSTWVSTQPSKLANYVVATATAGNQGGNASGATAGSAGAGGAIATAAQMPLGWPYVRLALVGQAGAAGGTTSSGTAVTLPVTGLRVTGGTGGGGLPGSGTGSIGGQLTVPASPSYFPAQLGGVGPTTATTPANAGRSGFNVRDAGFYYYGGTGGSSTHGGATGTGLVQGAGGNGGIGSGGGGSGGALTGSTPADNSYGGSGLVIITCY